MIMYVLLALVATALAADKDMMAGCKAPRPIKGEYLESIYPCKGTPGGKMHMMRYKWINKGLNVYREEMPQDNSPPKQILEMYSVKIVMGVPVMSGHSYEVVNGKCVKESVPKELMPVFGLPKGAIHLGSGQFGLHNQIRSHFYAMQLANEKGEPIMIKAAIDDECLPSAILIWNPKQSCGRTKTYINYCTKFTAEDDEKLKLPKECVGA